MRAESRRDLSTGQPRFDGSALPRPEGNFRPGLFGDVCRLVYGEKADTKIAAVVGCSDRQAREYLAERVEAPAILILDIMAAITRKRRRRH